MIKIAAQLRNDWLIEPYSARDKDEIKVYHPNQIVKLQITGVRKPRSYQQLKWAHVMMKLIAENSPDPRFDSIEKVKFHIKCITDFRDPELVFVRPDGGIQFQYRSFGYHDLRHFEACRLFDRIVEIGTKILGCSEEELINMSKRLG